MAVKATLEVFEIYVGAQGIIPTVRCFSTDDFRQMFITLGPYPLNSPLEEINAAMLEDIKPKITATYGILFEPSDTVLGLKGFNYTI